MEKNNKLGREIDLFDAYPKSKRPIEERCQTVTEADKGIAKEFGKEYFDGSRNQGYGGYNYDPRFFQPVIKRIQNYYNLTSESNVLDVGCGKGFMLHDFRELIPGIRVAGIDISEYAIEQAMPDVKPLLKVANAKGLPFPDNSFDLVLSINTIHNIDLEGCKNALREIERVSKRHKFIIVDSWRNEKEHELMGKWNLTALTYFGTDGWKKLFKEVGYTGDFYWFLATTA